MDNKTLSCERRANLPVAGPKVCVHFERDNMALSCCMRTNLPLSCLNGPNSIDWQRRAVSLAYSTSHAKTNTWPSLIDENTPQTPLQLNTYLAQDAPHTRKSTKVLSNVLSHVISKLCIVEIKTRMPPPIYYKYLVLYNTAPFWNNVVTLGPWGEGI